MKKISRRGFFTGAFLVPESPPEVAKIDPEPPPAIQDLLKKSRNRAPWEKPVIPTEPTGQIARVLTFDCLITLGSTCRSCIERCPIPEAIFMDGRLPVIDVNLCNGCGDCVLACPAPRPAIVLGPKNE